jgi:hypothetical protein
MLRRTLPTAKAAIDQRPTPAIARPVRQTPWASRKRAPRTLRWLDRISRFPGRRTTRHHNATALATSSGPTWPAMSPQIATKRRVADGPVPAAAVRASALRWGGRPHPRTKLLRRRQTFAPAWPSRSSCHRLCGPFRQQQGESESIDNDGTDPGPAVPFHRAPHLKPVRRSSTRPLPRAQHDSWCMADRTSG